MDKKTLQVGNSDEVEVGETRLVPIAELGEVEGNVKTKTLTIQGLMQVQCESVEELNAWVGGNHDGNANIRTMVESTYKVGRVTVYSI